MPTKPAETKSMQQADTAAVMNALASDIPASALPEGRSLPQVVAGDVASLRAMGNIIVDYKPARNAFTDALVNRIAATRITSITYQNPWAFLKQGILEYGETIEEIFIEMAKPYQFDPEDAETTLYQRYKPDVKSVFHSMNFQKFYPMTISINQLRAAFLSFDGMDNFIEDCIKQVYTGANFDEFQVMKYLIARCALQGEIHAESIPAISKENAQDVTTAMVEIAKNLQFPSKKYNFAGVTNFTDPSYLTTFLTTEAEAIFDVNVLAMAFHMEKAELIGRQISVDGFGTFDEERLALLFADDPYTTYKPFTTEEKTALGKIVGLMADSRWFMIYDNMIEMDDVRNGKGLYMTYFYHKWATFSMSPFHNAILFTSDPIAVSQVTTAPPTATVPAGTTVLVRATVDTTGFADKSVKWSISGNTGTTKLVVNPNDPLVCEVKIDSHQVGELIVTATSEFNKLQAGETTITIG